MAVSLIFERWFKRLFIVCALIAGSLHFYKDDWPQPDFYGPGLLEAPLQTITDQEAFPIEANGFNYTVHPKFAYELSGVVVSTSNADRIDNIWHHKLWKDFINVRDLCVIWGRNVESGVYQRMQFHSDSWTCWAQWPNQEVGAVFSMNALSNNHIVTSTEDIKEKLMQAEPGDLIRFSGVLAEYVNHTGGYTRGTSISREDTGQGACETVYLEHFEIVKKANARLRGLAKLFNGLTLLAFLGFIVFFLIAPAKPKYR